MIIDPKRMKEFKKLIQKRIPENLRKKPDIILSGPSGCGKTTIARSSPHGITHVDKDYLFSVSAATREKRINEIDGVDYNFMNEIMFKRTPMIEDNAYLGNGKMYGTLASEVIRIILNEGKRMVLDLDINGGNNVKNLLGDNAFFVFIKTPIDILFKRLENRMVDTGETYEIINKRIEAAKKEQELIEKQIIIPDFILNYDDNVSVGMAVNEIKLKSFHPNFLK
ncbi:MAG: hypothetical protein KBC11_01235 [Candidatus Pacebacteria bacterium]|nr:hypothetical protein [Candidatus Paceibacterota bacterium]